MISSTPQGLNQLRVSFLQISHKVGDFIKSIILWEGGRGGGEEGKRERGKEGRKEEEGGEKGE